MSPRSRALDAVLLYAITERRVIGLRPHFRVPTTVGL